MNIRFSVPLCSHASYFLLCDIYLCILTALSGIAALVLMELHSHKQLAQCEAVSEVDIRTAAMNYAIAVLDTFKNPVE